MHLEQAKEKLRNGSLRVLSIDTSALRAAGYRLEHGPLELLKDLRSAGVHVVLSDVVYREMRGHLLEKANKTFDDAQRSLRHLSEQVRVPEDELLKVLGPIQLADVEMLVDKRLDRFIQVNHIEVLDSAKHCDVSCLLDSYFQPAAPFEDHQRKKNEFPDAIALLSLAAWADKNDAHILLASQDIGWKNFAENSTRLACTSSVSEALSLIQERDVHVLELAQKLAQRILSAEFDGFDIHRFFLDAVSGQAWSPFAYSTWRYEAELIQASINGVDLSNAADARPVSFTEEELTIRIPVTFEMEATVRFSFFAKTSNWPAGETVRTRRFRKDVDVLVTIESPLNEPVFHAAQFDRWDAYFLYFDDVDHPDTESDVVHTGDEAPF